MAGKSFFALHGWFPKLPCLPLSLEEMLGEQPETESSTRGLSPTGIFRSQNTQVFVWDDGRPMQNSSRLALEILESDNSDWVADRKQKGM